jgi:radical SAM superfamily enzyme YgiQ (UPF0313 family)
MDKILFINPSWDYITKIGKRHNRKWPPLSLLNCATILNNSGFRAEIIDANALELNSEEVVKAALKYEKIFVTSSSLDRWQCPNLDVKPVEQILEKIGSKEVYLIGAHGSLMPQYFLNKFNLKAVIIGEPEMTVKEICENKEIFDIQGVVYKHRQKIIANKPRNLIDLNDLPVPDFSLLPLKKYSYELMGSNFVLFELSRGCPYNCVYCLQKMYGQIYRIKSIKHLAREIETAVNDYGIKNAYFVDLEMTVNKKAVAELCDLLINKKMKLKWCCQTRADTVDFELLKKMRKAGCVLIHYGVETGSPRIMKLIEKKITHEQILKAINFTHKAGIETACFFMFGFPTETDEEMEMTIDFAKKLNPTYASFHTATIYPGTKLFKMVNGKIGLPFLEAYTKEHSSKKLKGVTRKAFLEFYLRPGYIISRILTFNPQSWLKQFKLFLRFIKD